MSHCHHPLWKEARRFVAVTLCAAMCAVAIPQPAAAASAFDGRTLLKGILQGRGPVADLIPEIAAHFKLEYYVSKENLPAVEQRLEAAIDRMEAADSTFLPEFKRVMESGDHLAIELMLHTAGERMTRALLEDPEIRAAMEKMAADSEAWKAQTQAHLDSLSNLDWAEAGGVPDFSDVDDAVQRLAYGQPLAFGFAAALAFVVWVAGAIDLVLAVNAAIVLNAAVFFAVSQYVEVYTPEKAITGNVDLLGEEIVNSIAVGFSG